MWRFEIPSPPSEEMLDGRLARRQHIDRIHCMLMVCMCMCVPRVFAYLFVQVYIPRDRVPVSQHRELRLCCFPSPLV